MKIIVGMSGGVDSSVAALKLIQDGHQVTGVFMKNWEDDDLDNCTSEEDYFDALQVCKKLNIELKTINFSKEYMEKVFEVSLAALQKGATPNPDILCNKEIKFKCFFEHAINLGADCIATGHYAKIEKKDDNYYLKKAFDHNKDQTYFLYTLNQTNLAKIIFPLGNIDKTMVREIAKTNGLPNYNKKDSTGICFIGERNYKEFISTYLLKNPGDIIDVDGNLLGQHDGLMFYTLGQRGGLNIGGKKGYEEKPWYVLKKDMSSNTLMIGQNQNHPRLMSNNLICNNLHWINKNVTNKFQCNSKIRYRQNDQECMISPLSDNTAKVNFINPQRAITPGQSIVFYDNDVCLGGGIISDALISSN